MKTMSEIRQNNLKKLSAAFKNQRAFADALDATPGYVNQLLTGHTGIGEKAARKIEEKLRLHHLALDDIAIIETATGQGGQAGVGRGLSNAEIEQNQADGLLSKNQTKTLNDLRQLLAKDIDPMDMVTLQQIIGMLTNKYQDKKG